MPVTKEKTDKTVYNRAGGLLCKSLGESVLDHYLLDSATLMKTRHQTPYPIPDIPRVCKPASLLSPQKYVTATLKGMAERILNRGAYKRASEALTCRGCGDTCKIIVL